MAHNAAPSAAASGEEKPLLAPQKELKANTGTATSFQLTLNLVACGLGTGVFTLPWSTAGASIVPSVLIIGGVLLLNAWTITFLVRAAEKYQAFDLGSLLRHVPGNLGQFAEAICNGAMWISMFLCLVSYHVAITDGLQASWTWRQPPRSLFVLLSGLLVLPLCFLDQCRLSVTSAMALLANLNLYALLVYLFSVSDALPTACMMGVSPGGVTMVSTMMQSVVVQGCVLPMYGEMKDRSPGKFDLVLAASFTLLFFFFCGFAIFGYMAFGSKVESDILNNLPTGPWSLVSRLGAAVAIMGCYPILIPPVIAPLRSYFRERTTEESPVRTYMAEIATFGLVLMATLIGIVAKDLGHLNVVNGAFSTGVFVGICPSFVGLFLADEASQPKFRASMYVLCAVGIIFAVTGLIMTDNLAEEMKASCIWSHKPT